MISRAIISQIISGRRQSPKTERRIAEYLGKPAEYLFPFRTAEESSDMRRAEAEGKGAAA
jgi:transcriptional regulator with XRE-family HTH domain